MGVYYDFTSKHELLVLLSPLSLIPVFFSPPSFSRQVEEITEEMSHVGPDSCIP